jgi:dTDP-glucose 4,6-dehydratase
LLEAVRLYWRKLGDKVKSGFRFPHVSTDEVCGSLTSAEPAFTEPHPYRPNNLYLASKAASNYLVRAYIMFTDFQC